MKKKKKKKGNRREESASSAWSSVRSVKSKKKRAFAKTRRLAKEAKEEVPVEIKHEKEPFYTRVPPPLPLQESKEVCVPKEEPSSSSTRDPQPSKRARSNDIPPPSDFSGIPATDSILPRNPDEPPPPQRRRPYRPPETKKDKDKRKFKEWLEDTVKLSSETYLPLFEKEECDLYSFIFDLDEEGLEDLGIWDKMNKLHRKRFLRFRDELMEKNKTVISLFSFFFFPFSHFFPFCGLRKGARQ